MRSLSYIIILMSLIGTYQSEKISCIQNSFKDCFTSSKSSLSKKEVKTLVKGLNRFLAQSKEADGASFALIPNFQFNKITSQRDFKFNFFGLLLDKELLLYQQISKIRNKDHLEHRFYI